MTVAEMTPHQLYGLIMLAIVVAALGALGLSAYRSLTTLRQKFVFWVGAGFLFGLPAYFGLTALAPPFH